MRCNICRAKIGLSAIRNPACGHRFCRPCFNQWVSQEKQQDQIYNNQFRCMKCSRLWHNPPSKRSYRPEWVRDRIRRGNLTECQGCGALIERSTEGQCEFVECVRCHTQNYVRWIRHERDEEEEEPPVPYLALFFLFLCLAMIPFIISSGSYPIQTKILVCMVATGLTYEIFRFNS